MSRARSDISHCALTTIFFRVTQLFIVRTLNHPSMFVTGSCHIYQWSSNHLFPLPTLALGLPMCHAFIDLPWYCSLQPCCLFILLVLLFSFFYNTYFLQFSPCVDFEVITLEHFKGVVQGWTSNSLFLHRIWHSIINSQWLYSYTKAYLNLN